MDEKSTIFEVIELKGSTTTLCYGDATKEKITKKRLPERGLWSSAPLLSRSAIFVANPIAAMTIDLEKLAIYIKDIWNSNFFANICVNICQYICVNICHPPILSSCQNLPVRADSIGHLKDSLEHLFKRSFRILFKKLFCNL